ncbi:hypothetical protein BJX99DRAFT_261079 [Aspergillus californicus]
MDQGAHPSCISPTPLLEPAMNKQITVAGYEPVKFIPTDLWPVLNAWEQIVKRNENISYISEHINATRSRRLPAAGKEYHIFNLCFHHFDDEAAGKVLLSAVQSTDAFT